MIFFIDIDSLSFKLPALNDKYASKNTPVRICLYYVCFIFVTGLPTMMAFSNIKGDLVFDSQI